MFSQLKRTLLIRLDRFVQQRREERYRKRHFREPEIALMHRLIAIKDHRVSDARIAALLLETRDSEYLHGRCLREVYNLLYRHRPHMVGQCRRMHLGDTIPLATMARAAHQKPATVH